MSDTAIINCTVLEIRPWRQGRIVALARIELDIEGVCLVLDGVQIYRYRLPGDAREIAGVRPPRFRAPDGNWRETVALPPEVERALTDVVLLRCRELGIADCRRVLASAPGGEPAS